MGLSSVGVVHTTTVLDGKMLTWAKTKAGGEFMPKGNRSPKTEKQLQALARTNLIPKTEKQIRAGIKNLTEDHYATPRVSPALKVLSKTVCISQANENKILEFYGVSSLTKVLKKIVKGIEHGMI
jgi:hypothetical protein